MLEIITNFKINNPNKSIIINELYILLETYIILQNKFLIKYENINKKLLFLHELSLLEIYKNFESTINLILNFIIDNNKFELYQAYNYLYLDIVNNLILDILDMKQQCNIIHTNFINIKTDLFPYQINNLNWMLNIENHIYDNVYKDISKKIIFKGGGLFDEVGLGKTLQIITLCNNNLSKYSSLIKEDKIYSKATLIIVPNHLCGQWYREFNNHTKHANNIINLLTKRHYDKYTYYDLMKADIIIVSSNFFINCKLDINNKINKLKIIVNIFNKNVNLFNIYWHRIVIDEFHEIEENNLFKKVKSLSSDYRWILSGTPLKETILNDKKQINQSSLSNILDFLTHQEEVLSKLNFINLIDYNYIKEHFSRNLHKNNLKILKLPTIVEHIEWLNFSESERMIYNAYIADPNNTENDIFLRQICCHPMISDKVRENIPNKVENLSDIQDNIKEMYFKDYEKAENNYLETFEKIEKMKIDLANMEKENKINLHGYKNLKEEYKKTQDKLIKLNQIKIGKEKTINYYKTFIELISDMKNITNQECTICLDIIKETDLGITQCGHIFCYTCISTVIKESLKSHIETKCPNCSKHLSLDKIFYISKKNNEDVNILGTKIAFIINYIKNTPNKYRIIFSQWDYLLKQIGKILTENNIKNLYCQGNVYQKDKVLKLFNDNNIIDNEHRIIMLSSDSTVSGSNLTNAEEIIFLDPVYGDKQYISNIENQAIGRVRRLGNKFKQIKIIRLLIKDSVEEEIFKSRYSK